MGDSRKTETKGLCTGHKRLFMIQPFHQQDLVTHWGQMDMESGPLPPAHLTSLSMLRKQEEQQQPFSGCSLPGNAATWSCNFCISENHRTSMEKFLTVPTVPQVSVGGMVVSSVDLQLQHWHQPGNLVERHIFRPHPWLPRSDSTG